MIKKVCAVLLPLSFVVPTLASAADDDADAVYHGSIELGLMSADVNSRNGAKFGEYKDMSNGLFGNIQFSAVKDSYFMQLDAANPGRDDQSVDFRGGAYGLFRYDLYYDELPHNYSDGISPYGGIGGYKLTAPTASSPWTPFEYSVQHKKYGGEVELFPGGPYFLNFGVERRQQEGLRPYSISGAELPMPISYTTDNLNVKGGYLGKTITASVNGYLSSFNNDYQYMTLGSTLATAAPDNDMGKIGGDFSWRALPLKSTLGLSASYSHLSDSYSLTDLGITSPPAGLNRTTFDGKVDYTTFSASLVSQPLPKLDSRVYYRYVNRDDNSSQIYTNLNTANNYLEMLSYDRNAAGIELGYRLPQRTKLSVGYDYEGIDRSTPLDRTAGTSNAPSASYGNTPRYENPSSTTDNSFFAKVKNSSFDWLTSTLQYKHLERSSDYLSGQNPYVNLTNVVRLDAADKSTDEVKLGFDFMPFDRLDLGIDFTYQKNDYDYNPGSRDSDDRGKVYFDATWRPWKKVVLNTFVGYEHSRTDDNYRTTLTAAQILPNYVQTLGEDFWTYGISLDLPDIINRLSFKITWQYEDSNGSMKYDRPVAGANLLSNTDNADDYNKQTLNAKATYAFDDHLSVSLGYLYERFNSDDVGFANYANSQWGQWTSTSLSGLYYGQDYVAHVGYASIAYKF